MTEEQNAELARLYQLVQDHTITHDCPCNWQCPQYRELFNTVYRLAGPVRGGYTVRTTKNIAEYILGKQDD